MGGRYIQTVAGGNQSVNYPPQIIVDEHIRHRGVTDVLQGWITAEQIGFEVGYKGLSDEQIISLLHKLPNFDE